MPSFSYDIVPGLQAAQQLSAQGDQDAALEAYDKAACDHPRNARVLVEAARAHARRFNVQRVDYLLDQLRNLAPDFPGVQHLAGEVYAYLALPQKALPCFERAAALPGVLPETWVALADLHERAHRLDRACECVQMALRSEPRFPTALLTQARIERRAGKNEQAENLLRDLILALPQDREIVCRAWGELAQLLDEQGDYDGAFQAIQSCKQPQLRRDQAEWAAATHVAERFGRMVASVTAADFQHWHEAKSSFRAARVALLCGFPRSGTTLVEQILAAHPDVITSEERGFLAQETFPAMHRGLSPNSPVQDVLSGVDVRRLSIERKRYLAAMEALLCENLKNRLHIDKNPAYVPFLPVYLRLFPEARLIVTLRDPRDVVISCYMRYLPLNPLSVNFLTLERTVARYKLDLQAWFRFRELVQAVWCELRYEDVIDNIEHEARRMFETLSLPWEPQVLDFQQRSQRRIIHSPSYEAVAKPVYTTAIGRWHNYSTQLEPFLNELEPLIETLGYNQS